MVPTDHAEVAKLVYAPDLGSGVARHASSSLALGTKNQLSAISCQKQLAADFHFSHQQPLTTDRYIPFDIQIPFSYPFFCK